MPTQIQWRRGNTAQTAAFTGALAEITVDTDTYAVVVHDGVTPGGHPVASSLVLQSAFDKANAAYEAANTDYSELASQLANDEIFVAAVNASQNSEIQTKVSKSGDTMTGTLNLTDATASGNIIISGDLEANNLVVDTTLYSGLATRQATPLPNLIAQFTGNTNSYVQVNAQNIDEHGTSDYVITADVGSDTEFYADFGITNSNYDNQNPNNSLGTAVGQLDGYLYIQGSSIDQPGGNLVIGTTHGNTETRIIAGGHDAENVVVTFGSDLQTVFHGNVNPSIDNTYDLGSPDNTWRSLYLGPGSLHIDKIVLSNTNGKIVITGASDIVFANSSLPSSSQVSNKTNSAFVQANSAYNTANSSGVYANGAFIQANSAYNAANSAGVYANGAFIQANSAYDKANSAGVYANGAFTQANSAYNQANTATTNAAAASSYANSAYDKANSSGTYANSAFVEANAAFIHANAAYDFANTLILGNATDSVARNIANSAGVYANGAFIQANSAYDEANTAYSVASDAANFVSSVNVYSYGAFTQANASFEKANAAFAAANSAVSAITNLDAASVVLTDAYGQLITDSQIRVSNYSFFDSITGLGGKPYRELELHAVRHHMTSQDMGPAQNLYPLGLDWTQSTLWFCDTLTTQERGMVPKPGYHDGHGNHQTSITGRTAWISYKSPVVYSTNVEVVLDTSPYLWETLQIGVGAIPGDNMEYPDIGNPGEPGLGDSQLTLYAYNNVYRDSKVKLGVTEYDIYSSAPQPAFNVSVADGALSFNKGFQDVTGLWGDVERSENAVGRANIILPPGSYWKTGDGQNLLMGQIGAGGKNESADNAGTFMWWGLGFSAIWDDEFNLGNQSRSANTNLVQQRGEEMFDPSAGDRKGNTIISWHQTNRVGIMNLDPKSTLSVKGDVHFNGGPLRLGEDLDPGTAGAVLVSRHENGNPVWSTQLSVPSNPNLPVTIGNTANPSIVVPPSSNTTAPITIGNTASPSITVPPASNTTAPITIGNLTNPVTIGNTASPSITIPSSSNTTAPITIGNPTNSVTIGDPTYPSISIPSSNTANILLIAPIVISNCAYYPDGTIQTTAYSNSVLTHANTAYDQANTANSYAIDAYLKANAAYNTANSSYVVANAAYLQANTPSYTANSASVYANAAFTQANAAYLQANTPSYTANSAAIYANSAFTQANAAYLQANTPSYTANSASEYANAAFAQANAAFIVANNANAIYASGGTIAGDVKITSTTGSSTYQSGALVVSGGVGIGQNLNVYGNTILSGSLTVNGPQVITSSSVVAYQNPYIILHEPTTGYIISDDGTDVGVDFEYYAPTGIAPRVITGGSADGANATIYITDNTYLKPGTIVTVSNVTPSNFNGTFKVTSAAAGQITYALAYTGTVNTSGTLGTLSRLLNVTVTGGSTVAGTKVSTINITPAVTLSVGQTVTIFGCSPAGYDGTWTILSASAGSFTFQNTSNLGNITVNGSVVLDNRRGFFGRSADSGAFEFYKTGSWTPANTFAGVYGTLKAGQFDATPSDSITSADIQAGAIVIANKKITDSTSTTNASNPQVALANLGIVTIASSAANVNYAGAATLRIQGAPVAGNNVSLDGQVYALQVDTGDSYFGGSVYGNALYDSGQRVLTVANLAANTGNISFNTSNASFIQANAAFNTGNAAYTQANASFIQANSAYNQANTANSNAAAASSYANSAFVFANGAFIQANSAYNQSNTYVWPAANSAGSYANSAYTQANTATTNAATADSKAVTAGSYANSAFGVANSASIYANGAFAQANAAFTKANGAVQTGWTTITANGTSITPTGNTDTLSITAATANGIQILTTSGGLNADVIDFGLQTSGATAGWYGGSTQIPSVNVDKFGRITSIANNTVSTTITLAANTGSGSVSGGGTLTVQGGTSISTSVSGSTIIINNNGVTSFNGLTGAVTLSSANVSSALGYTPANIAGDAFTGAISSSGSITGSSLVANTGITVNTNGYITTTSYTTTTTSQNTIDSFATTTYRSAKYEAQITSSTSYHVIELRVVHDGASAWLTQYGEIFTGSSLGTFDASVSAGNLNLLFTPTNAATTIRLLRTTITV